MDSLNKLLCEINTYSSQENRESLLFLVRSVATARELERIDNDSLSSEVFTILCQKASTVDALALLQRMLLAANYDQKRVAMLSSDATSSQLSFDQSRSVSLPLPYNLATKVSFYELLLLISQKIGKSTREEVILQHLKNAITEEKLRAPKQDIKSTLQLFSHMLVAGMLVPSNPHSLVSELQEPLCSLRCKDEKVVMVIADIEEVIARNVRGRGGARM